jgi:peptide/nickel transport system substrate-binding protein
MRPPVHTGAAVALVGALVLGVPVPAATAADDGARKTLTVAIPDNQKNLTPYTAPFEDPGYGLVTLLYDTLLWHDHENNLVPWLAEDYSLTADGLNVNVTLREAVRWSDGRPLTADDVKFTYEYVQEFEHPRFTPAVKGAVAAVTTEGPRKVTFRLAEPRAAFLTSPLAEVPILPAHVWSNIRESYPSKKAEKDLPVGSGPFRVTQYKAGKSLQLDVNAGYFMTPSSIQRLNLQVVGDPGAQASAIRAGKVDALAVNLSPDTVRDLRAAPGVTLVTGSDYTTTALTMNTTRPPFDNAEFRRAVRDAIDLGAVVGAAADGLATPASPGFIHPESPFYRKDVVHEFDVGRANASLDRLGYSTKDADGVRKSREGRRLEFEILVDGADPIDVRAAQAVSTQLAAAGVNGRVVQLASATKSQRETSGPDFDFSVTSAGPEVQDDPGKLAGLLGTGGSRNVGRWSNADFDAGITAQGAAIDRRQRIAILGDLQAILAAESPSVALFHRNGGYAFRSTAYGDWVYVKGKGIVDKLSFVRAVPRSPSDRAAVPPPETGDDDGGGGVVAVVAGLLVVAAILGFLLFVRKGRVKARPGRRSPSWRPNRSEAPKTRRPGPGR